MEYATLEISLEIHEPPHPDLPVWSYTESDEHNGRQWRHIRRIKVLQFDRIVEYVEDMGPYGGAGFVIPGGIRHSGGRYESLHTVGELSDVAEQFKLTSRDYWQLSYDESQRLASKKKGRTVYGRRYVRR